MSEDTIQPEGIHAKLAQKFPEDIVAVDVLADGQQISEVTPDGLFQVVAYLQKRYPLMSVMSGYDVDNELGIFYSFLKLAQTPEDWGEVCLRVRLPRPEGADGSWTPAVPSLCDLMPAANWQEREIWDLYGIRFEGHPDLRRIFMPDDWTGFPGRRDYKEPEQFVAMRHGEDVTLRTQEEGSW